MSPFKSLILGLAMAMAFASSLSAEGSVGASKASVDPLRLHEYQPATTTTLGPDKAKGVLYFIEGLDKGNRGRDDFKVTYPIVTDMNTRLGWDVIVAKFPNDANYEYNAIPRSARYALENLRTLKAKGYKRIVLGGQSWGAWTSVEAAALDPKNEVIDSLLLLAPANYGTREIDGKPNEHFFRNKTEYAALIKRVRTPTVAVFYEGDDFDPGGRGEITAEALGKAGAPLLLIDRPPGFKGHGGAWQPLFSYRYDACIAAFLETAASTKCAATPPATTTDARSISRESDIKTKARLLTLKDLSGKSLVFITRDGFSSLRTFSGDKAQVTSGIFKGEERLSMKGDQICIEKQCRRVYALTEGSYMSFDDAGNASSWITPAN